MTMTLLSKADILLLILQTSACLSKFGSSGFVEYREGNVGIIIAVPHGGSWDYEEIPNRKYGVLEGDDHTRELGEVVTTAICRNLGKCPHLIMSNLKRSKLDPNRNKNEAAQGNSKAEKAWEEYQGFIEEAKKIEGIGVVIDLHGQSHRQNSTELGYLLSTTQLNSGDYDSAKSSVKHLARRLAKSGKEVITGSHSLGAYLEKEGYKALPSPRQLAPGEQEYFTGGFTVERHGSRNQGKFDAILVETPREVRIDAGRVTRIRFGEALGRAIALFYIDNYPQNSLVAL